ncbi:MAG: hypothetical protein J0H62_05365 [Rhizobiales bacterium]|nr:hypothetical protein [Hyphomicrobiales bacterium]
MAGDPLDVLLQVRRLAVDGAIAASGATTDFVSMIGQAGPYGSGNAEPVFAFPGHTLAHAEPLGDRHLRVRLRSRDGAFVSGMAFRAGDKPLGRALIENRGRVVHVAGSLAIDRWQGSERVSLRIIDIAPAEPNTGTGG